MDSDDPHLRTTVRPSAQAGCALPTRHVRVHRASVARLELPHAVSSFHDLDGEFMSENTWITEKWLRPFKCMEIGAAYADCQYTDQHFARSRRAWLRRVRDNKFAGLFKNDCSHGIYVSTVHLCPCRMRLAPSSRAS